MHAKIIWHVQLDKTVLLVQAKERVIFKNC